VDDEVVQAALDRLRREEERMERAYTPLFDPPAINLAFVADYEHEDEAMDMGDAWAEAWDRVRQDPEWSAWVRWYDESLQLMYGRNIAYFEDREQLSFRRVRDGQSMYVPMAMLRAAEDAPALMSQLVAAFFERRADALGLRRAPSRPSTDMRI